MSKSIKAWERPIVWIAAVATFVIVYWLILMPMVSCDTEKQGHFGDSFGALNTFFSGCAFTLLLLTLWQQRKDNAASQVRAQDDRHLQTLTAQVSASAVIIADVENRLGAYKDGLGNHAPQDLTDIKLLHWAAFHKTELAGLNEGSLQHGSIKHKSFDDHQAAVDWKESIVFLLETLIKQRKGLLKIYDELGKIEEQQRHR